MIRKIILNGVCSGSKKWLGISISDSQMTIKLLSGKHVIRKNPLHFPIQVILVELCQVKQLKEKNKKIHLPIFRCCGPKMKCTFVYCPIHRVTAELTLLSLPKLPRCTPGLNRLLIIQDRVSLHKIFWVSIIPQC